jgi:hypothetical protein
MKSFTFFGIETYQHVFSWPNTSYLVQNDINMCILQGVLVSGFKMFQTCLIFHNIWDVIFPIDELIFFKMVKTTNQCTILYKITWLQAPTLWIFRSKDFFWSVGSLERPYPQALSNSMCNSMWRKIPNLPHNFDMDVPASSCWTYDKYEYSY